MAHVEMSVVREMAPRDTYHSDFRPTAQVVINVDMVQLVNLSTCGSRLIKPFNTIILSEGERPFDVFDYCDLPRNIGTMTRLRRPFRTV